MGFHQCPFGVFHFLLFFFGLSSGFWTEAQTERIELINVERTTQELRPTKRNSLSPSLKVAARIYLDEKLGAEQVLYFSVTDNL